MNPSAKKVFSDIEYIFAFGFGSGLAPKAPGTVGSLFGLLVFLPLLVLPIWSQILIVVVGLIYGIFVCDRVAAELQLKDPGGIVWDEFVGMWIALLWLPSYSWLVLAFLLFRFFDVLKPWPVSLADRELEGGLGIMLDDVVAGLYALFSLHLIHWGYSQLI